MNGYVLSLDGGNEAAVEEEARLAISHSDPPGATTSTNAEAKARAYASQYLDEDTTGDYELPLTSDTAVSVLPPSSRALVGYCLELAPLERTTWSSNPGLSEEGHEHGDRGVHLQGKGSADPCDDTNEESSPTDGGLFPPPAALCVRGEVKGEEECVWACYEGEEPLGNPIQPEHPSSAPERSQGHLARAEFTSLVGCEKEREFRWMERLAEVNDRELSCDAEDREGRKKAIRDRVLILDEFAKEAERIGRQIILEHVTNAQKPRYPSDCQLKGVGSGDKFMYNGIFFKFTRDRYGIYGGDSGAMKAAGHELKSTQALVDVQRSKREALRSISVDDTPVSLTRSLREQLSNDDFDPALYLSENTLLVPPSVVCDFLGFRLICQAQLPIADQHTIVYGSSDGGGTYHSCDTPAAVAMYSPEKMAKAQTAKRLVQEAVAKLNLRGHRCKMTGSTEVFGPIDMEVHWGSYERGQEKSYLFALDLARLFPPSAVEKSLKVIVIPTSVSAAVHCREIARGREWLSDLMNTDTFHGDRELLVEHIDGAVLIHKKYANAFNERASLVSGGRSISGVAALIPNLRGVQLYQLLRKELVAESISLLSSDSYSGFQHPAARVKDNQEVQAATHHLLTAVIPDMAREINVGALIIVNNAVLVESMHERGINIRYLGLLCQYVQKVEVRNFIIQEMVSRICKRELRQRLRRLRGREGEGENAFFLEALDYFNEVFGLSAESDRFWNVVVKIRLLQHFSFSGETAECPPDCSESQSPPIVCGTPEKNSDSCPSLFSFSRTQLKGARVLSGVAFEDWLKAQSAKRKSARGDKDGHDSSSRERRASTAADVCLLDADYDLRTHIVKLALFELLCIKAGVVFLPEVRLQLQRDPTVFEQNIVFKEGEISSLAVITKALSTEGSVQYLSQLLSMEDTVTLDSIVAGHPSQLRENSDEDSIAPCQKTLSIALPELDDRVALEPQLEALGQIEAQLLSLKTQAFIHGAESVEYATAALALAFEFGQLFTLYPLPRGEAKENSLSPPGEVLNAVLELTHSATAALAATGNKSCPAELVIGYHHVLGRVQHYMGRTEDAISSYVTALQLLETVHGDPRTRSVGMGHPMGLLLCSQLSRCFCEVRNYTKSVMLHDKFLSYLSVFPMPYGDLLDLLGEEALDRTHKHADNSAPADIPWRDLTNIHLHKTGAMLSTSLFEYLSHEKTSSQPRLAPLSPEELRQLFRLITADREGKIAGIAWQWGCGKLQRFADVFLPKPVAGLLPATAPPTTALACESAAPSPPSSLLPPPFQFMVPKTRVVSIAVSQYHALAATEAGCVFSWGKGSDVLGHLSSRDVPTPRRIESIAGKHRVLRLSCDLSHAAAVTDEGRVLTWGYNSAWKLGRDGVMGAPLPVDSCYRFIRASCGANHTLFLTSTGKVLSCGDGSGGYLGHGTSSTDLDTPHVIRSFSDTPIREIFASNLLSAAISADGNLFTWGSSPTGALGHGGRATLQLRPRRVTLPGAVRTFAAAAHVSVAVLESGDVYHFGRTFSQGVTHHPTLWQVLPDELSGHAVVSVSPGDTHLTLILKEKATGKERVAVVGANSWGQLGLPKQRSQSSAAFVPGLEGTPISVASAFGFTLALLGTSD